MSDFIITKYNEKSLDNPQSPPTAKCQEEPPSHSEQAGPPTTQPGQRQDIHVVLLVHSNCCTVFNPVDPHLTTIHTKTSNIRPLLIIIIQVITANYHIIKLTIIISCKTSKYPFIAHYHNSNNETDNYRISLQ